MTRTHKTTTTALANRSEARFIPVQRLHERTEHHDRARRRAAWTVARAGGASVSDLAAPDRHAVSAAAVSEERRGDFLTISIGFIDNLGFCCLATGGPEC